MIVNTQRLFTRLARALGVSAICDVGSMNGAEALRFHRAAPRSRIYALEPNPDNFQRMRANPSLQERAITLLPVAASDCDGESDLYLVDAHYARQDVVCGLSSLYRRAGPMHPSTAAVRVRTTRLDTLLAEECAAGATLALWIDVEGKAYEVIEGTSGIADHVRLLHVEVETAPCIAPGQRLFPEVSALLRQHGFTELATDLHPSRTQFNALFVRGGLPARIELQVRAALLYERARYLTASLLWRLAPWGMRRYRR
jgi:FkbM family methyltransferase